MGWQEFSLWQLLAEKFDCIMQLLRNRNIVFAATMVVLFSCGYSSIKFILQHTGGFGFGLFSKSRVKDLTV